MRSPRRGIWRFYLKNCAVKAANSNRLSSRYVKIHLRRIHSKRCRLENWVFLHTLFLENEVQINKNNYATMLFTSNPVSLPKISLILQKIKIDPKWYICPFYTKAFNYWWNFQLIGITITLSPNDLLFSIFVTNAINIYFGLMW